MDFVKDISIAVREAVAGLGPLVIPAIIAAVVLVVLFAKNSYKLFRIGLPFLAALAGSYIGAGLLGGLVKDALPAVADIFNPHYVAGGLVALVLGLLCAKFHKLTMFLVGAGLGVLFIDELVKGLLWSLDFVVKTAESVPGGREGDVVKIVGIVILALCALVSAIILVKFFKGIYILVTAVGGLVVAAAVPAIFIFANTNFAEIAVIACAAIGLIFGIVNVCKQMKKA